MDLPFVSAGRPFAASPQNLCSARETAE